jgi:hypothetical protein
VKFDNERVLVDDFVVTISQLAMNFHAKTYELKNFFFVKQFRHKSAGTRISRIYTKVRPLTLPHEN